MRTGIVDSSSLKDGPQSALDDEYKPTPRSSHTPSRSSGSSSHKKHKKHKKSESHRSEPPPPPPKVASSNYLLNLTLF